MWGKAFRESLWAASVIWLAFFATTVGAQTPPDRAKQTADRFLQVLERRPTPGTALDRVYAYHLQAGTLDELIDGQEKSYEEKVQSNAPEAAARHATLLGLLHSRRGDQPSAVEAYLNAEKASQDDAAISFELGKSLVAIGKSGEAVEAFRRSIDKEPPRRLAMSVYQALASLLRRTGQSAESVEVYEQFESAFPDDVSVRERIASALADQGQWERALKRYEALASSNAESNDGVRFAIEAADIKTRLGRREESLEDLDRLLSRVRPGSWLYENLLARIDASFESSNDIAGLADFYDKRVAKQPGNLSLRMRQASILSRSGDLASAIVSLQATVESAPSDVAARMMLARVLRQNGKFDEAIEQFRSLVELAPDDPDHRFALASVIEANDAKPVDQRRLDAGKVLGKLAENRSKDPVMLAQIADRLVVLNQGEQAQKLYQKAIDQAPEEPQYREYLGQYLFRDSRVEEAEKVWRGMVADGRANKKNWIRLSGIYQTFDFDEKALKAYEQAAEFDLDFGERVRFVSLLGRADRFVDAMRQLDQAEKQAETFEESSRLLRERIKLLSQSGELKGFIDEQAARVDEKPTADGFRRLAILLAADGRREDAIDQVESAIELEPENTNVLSLRAELLEQTGRYQAAIEAYQALLPLDVRYQMNYLKQISNLQMRTGLMEDAIETAEQLVSLRPQTPDSYQFLASQAASVGDDDKAIETLRRALAVVPNDQATQRRLAEQLAKAFRTDEAIELHWQRFERQNSVDDRVSIVTDLGPLYERQGRVDELINRLEDFGREEASPAVASRLIASLHQTLGDAGLAIDKLEPLLSNNPRDGGLLKELVSLNQSVNQYDQAIEFQQRLVELASTEENQQTLLRLKLLSGRLDGAEADRLVLESASTELLAVRLVDRAMRQEDYARAERLAGLSLDRFPKSWELLVRLGWLKLLNDQADQVDQIIAKIEAMDISPDTPSEEFKELEKRRKSRRSTSSNSVIYRSSIQPREYEIARVFGIGRYANSNITFSSSQPLIVSISSFDQANQSVDSIRLTASMIDDSLEQYLDSVDQTIVGEDASQEDVSSVYRIYSQLSRFGEANLAERTSRRMQELSWRMARLEPAKASSHFPAALRKPRVGNSSNQEMSKLETEQKAFLTNWVIDSPDLIDGIMTTSISYQVSPLRRSLAANDLNQALAALDARFIGEPTNLSDAARGIAYCFYAIDEDEPVNELAEKIWKNFNGLAAESNSKQVAEFETIVTQMLPRGGAPAHSSVLPTFVELMIASRSERINRSTAAQRQRMTVSRQLSQGGNAGVYFSGSSGYRNLQIPIPFDDRFLSSQTASAVYQALTWPDETAERDVLMFRLANQQGALDPETAGGKHELRTRTLLRVFGHWWNGDLPTALDQITALAKETNEDSVRLEAARMAAESKKPDLAMQYLEQIQPLDRSALSIRELATLNLAMQLGQTERAKEAAGRLFGMRLPTATQMQLASSMRGLEMNDLSAAVLRRLNRKGNQSFQDLMSLADAFVEAGDSEAAAEVAFKALKKVEFERYNQDYYRRQAVEKLRKVGRLDAVIAKAERVAKSPNASLTAKLQLSQLYRAAGKQAEAENVLDGTTETKSNSPKALLKEAEALASAGKNNAAAVSYLKAIQMDPRGARNAGSRLRNIAYQIDKPGSVLDLLLEMDPKVASEIQFVESFMQNAKYRYRGQEEIEAKVKEFGTKLIREGSPKAIGSMIVSMNTRDSAEVDLYCDRIMELMGSDDSYNRGAWLFNSTNRMYSDGRRIGPIAKLSELLKQQPEFAKQLSVVVDEQIQSRPTLRSRLVGAVVGWQDLEKRDNAKEIITEVISTKGEGFSETVLAQVAAMVAVDDDDADLAVDLYRVLVGQTSTGTGRRFRSSHQHVLTKLLTRLGKKSEAVALLTKASKGLTTPDRIVSNYQYESQNFIQTCLVLSQRFLDADAPFESLHLLDQVLDLEDQFTGLRRYGSGEHIVKSREEWQQRWDSAFGKVSQSSALAWLKRWVESGCEGQTALREFDFTNYSQANLVTMAVDAVLEEEQGALKLMEWVEASSGKERSKAQVAGLWQVGLREFSKAVTGVEVGSNEDVAPDSLNESIGFSDMLVQLAEVSPEPKEAWIGLIDLFGYGLARSAQRASSSKLKESDGPTAKLRGSFDSLTNVAMRDLSDEVRQRVVSWQSIVDSGGAGFEQLLDRMLANLKGASGEGKSSQPRTFPTIEKLLDFAVKAADSKEFDVAKRAVIEAFKNGEPNVSGVAVNRSSGSLFLPGRTITSTSSQTLQHTIQTRIGLANRLQRLIDKAPDTAPDAFVFDVLIEAFLPMERPEKALEYARFDADEYYGLRDDFEPTSVSLYLSLVKAAEASGQMDELQKRLETRAKTLPGICLGLVAADSEKQRASALERLSDQLAANSAAGGFGLEDRNLVYDALIASATRNAIDSSFAKTLSLTFKKTAAAGQADCLHASMWLINRAIDSSAVSDESIDSLRESLSRLVEERCRAIQGDFTKQTIERMEVALLNRSLDAGRIQWASANTKLNDAIQSASVTRRGSLHRVIDLLGSDDVPDPFDTWKNIVRQDPNDLIFAWILPNDNASDDSGSLFEEAKSDPLEQGLATETLLDDPRVDTLFASGMRAAKQAGRVDEFKELLTSFATSKDSASASDSSFESDVYQLEISSVLGLVALEQNDMSAAQQSLEAAVKWFETPAEKMPSKEKYQKRYPIHSLALVARFLEQSGGSIDKTKLLRSAAIHAKKTDTAALQAVASNLVGRLGWGEASQPGESSLPSCFAQTIGNASTLIGKTNIKKVGDRWVFVGGDYTNRTFLRRPLTGDFRLSLGFRDLRLGHPSLTVGGINVSISRDRENAIVSLGSPRSQCKLPLKGFSPAGPHVWTMERRGDELTVSLDDNVLGTVPLKAESCFAAISTYGREIAQVESFNLSRGNEGASKIDLIEPFLPGWKPPYAGAIKDPELPAKDTRELFRAAAPFANLDSNGVLSLGIPSEVEGFRGVYVMTTPKPIFEGETLEFEMLHQDAPTNVQFGVGDAVLRMGNDNGVKVADRSMVTRVPEKKELFRVMPNEWRVEAGDSDVIKVGDWNQVRLFGMKDSIRVEINGSAIAKIPTKSDRYLRLYLNHLTKTKVRSMTLSGDWPTESSENLLSE